MRRFDQYGRELESTEPNMHWYWCRKDEVDEVLKRQAAAARSGMDAAKAISSRQLELAQKARAESSPDALESERQANALLTAENERLREDLELQRKIDLQIIAEKQQLRGNLSLAEEGLANYQQENERLRNEIRAANEAIEALNKKCGALAFLQYGSPPPQ